MERNLAVTASTVAAACIQNGIGQKAALNIWRAMGGTIRESEWGKVYAAEQELLREWLRKRAQLAG